MTLKEIERRLCALKRKGYVLSLRKGSTGVGYTFEQEMDLSETNIPVPDLGSTSLVTLFCFNRGVWHVSQKDLIKRYGYIDDLSKKALKNTILCWKADISRFTLEN